MKTSELKKILEENGFNLIEIHDTWIDIEREDMKVGYVSLLAEKDFKTNTCCPKYIAQVVLEYAYTPLEEREEEKKYWLKSKLKDRGMREVFVFKGGAICDNKMYLSVSIRSAFTQKEIDEMPFDTKFFEKVEVK